MSRVSNSEFNIKNCKVQLFYRSKLFASSSKHGY